MKPVLAVSLAIMMFGQPSLTQSRSVRLTASQDREAEVGTTMEGIEGEGPGSMG